MSFPLSLFLFPVFPSACLIALYSLSIMTLEAGPDE